MKKKRFKRKCQILAIGKEDLAWIGGVLMKKNKGNKKNTKNSNANFFFWNIKLRVWIAQHIPENSDQKWYSIVC